MAMPISSDRTGWVHCDAATVAMPPTNRAARTKALRLLDGADDVGLSSNDESRDQMIRAVPRTDLGQAIVHLYVLAIWTSGHVGIAEGIGDSRRLRFKLCGERSAQPTFLCFQPGTRVIRDETCDPLVDAKRPEPPRAIESMQPSVYQRRVVTDVMQPCRSHKHEPVLRIERVVNGFRLTAHGLDVAPATGEAMGEAAFCQRSRLTDRSHKS